MPKTYVISLGGSLIVPDGIDTGFLKKFRKLILDYVNKGNRFVIICGGGKTCRKYQNAAREIMKTGNGDLDWLGIYSTTLNAQLMLILFKDVACPEIIKNPNKKTHIKEKLVIASGWKPGFSTDNDAVLLAKNFNTRTIINLTDTDYVYDKDPDKQKDAKPIKKISWKEFRKIIGNKWKPGLNVPFDPVGSGAADSLGITVIIMRGLENLDAFLSGKKFKGTTIR